MKTYPCYKYKILSKGANETIRRKTPVFRPNFSECEKGPLESVCPAEKNPQKRGAPIGNQLCEESGQRAPCERTRAYKGEPLEKDGAHLKTPKRGVTHISAKELGKEERTQSYGGRNTPTWEKTAPQKKKSPPSEEKARHLGAKGNRAP